MTRDETVEAIRQQLAVTEGATRQQVEHLLAIIDEIQAEHQYERELVVQAQLDHNTYRTLIAAHQALSATHTRVAIEHERTEEALQETEARFQAIFERAAIGIGLVDLGGRIIESNPALQQMLGYSREELRHMVFTEVTHPDDVQADVNLFKELMAEQRDHYQIEKRYICKDGRIIWGRLTVSLIRDAKGSPQFAIVMIEDITERKRMEAMLQASEAHYRTIAELTSDYAYAFRVEPDGALVCEWVTDAFTRITGYTSGEVDARGGWTSLIHPDDLPIARRRYQALLAGQQDVSEFRVITKAGEVRWLHDSGQPEVDPEQNRVVRILGAASDITAQKRAERLLALEYAVSQVLAEAASFDDAASQLLQVIGEGLEWEVGVLWRVDLAAQVLRCRATWLAPASRALEFVALSRGLTIAPGTDLPGRVWSGGESIWVADVRMERPFVRFHAATQAGLQGAFAFPIRGGSDILGVIEFFSQQPPRPNADLLQTVAVLSHQIGQFIQQKRAETVIHESEVRKGAILEMALDAIITIDQVGRVIEWNPAAEQMFGYRRAEVIGRELASLIIPPSWRYQYRQNLTRYFATGKGALIGQRSELIAMRADGTEFPVEVAISRIPLAGPAMLTGFVRDISERKRAEAAQRFLAEASRVLTTSLDYETTLQSVARLAVPFLADGCCVDLLEADHAVRQLAIAHVDPAKEQILRELHDCYPLDRQQPDPILKVLQTGQSELIPNVSDTHLESIAHDAEHLYLLQRLNFTSAMIMPLLARGRTLGTLIFVAGESRDSYGPADLALAEELAAHAALAVDNARLYRESQQALRAHSEFLSFAAHELKTPLIGLFGATQVLGSRGARGHPIHEQDQDILHLIADTTQQLRKLIDSLVDFSHIQAGRFSLKRQPVNLCELAQRVVEELRPTSGHAVEFTSPDEALIIEGDEVRLERMLHNLLQNAIKYSPKGGLIAVQLERRGDEAYLAIHDEGIGIPEAEQPKLFQRFYRASNATSLNIRGMGIGLYLVNEIVTHHGGVVEVSSTEGKGSTFIIHLPLQAPAH
jgi:PAS domain S-box-containing protein